MGHIAAMYSGVDWIDRFETFIPPYRRNIKHTASPGTPILDNLYPIETRIVLWLHTSVMRQTLKEPLITSDQKIISYSRFYDILVHELLTCSLKVVAARGK